MTRQLALEFGAARKVASAKPRQPSRRRPRAAAPDRTWAAVFQLLSGEGEAAERQYGHKLRGIA